MWELPSWQGFYGLTPSDWPRLRETVREVLADRPMTRDELGAAVTARPKFRHLGFAFVEQSWTLLKPLAWQGDMSFGRRETDVRRSSAWIITRAGGCA
jgi:hypothetical protein